MVTHMSRNVTTHLIWSVAWCDLAIAPLYSATSSPGIAALRPSHIEQLTSALPCDTTARQQVQPMQEDLYLARGWIQELQELALHCKSNRQSVGPKLPSILKQLAALHQLVSQQLVAHVEALGDGQEQPDQVTHATNLHGKLLQWQQTAAVAGISLTYTAERYAATRQQQLQQELSSLAEAAASLGVPEARQQQLERIVMHLRHLEETPGFQGRLLREAAATSTTSGYSEECFAYASTPFASWCQVVSHPEVSPVIQAALAAGGGRRYTVWGSSSGWLLWYGALGCGWRCGGVELLRCLVEVAAGVVQQEGLAGQVELVCDDLLHSSLEDTGVLLLADQCWDPPLQQQAVLKAVQKLPSPAVLISYNGSKIQQLLGERLQKAVTLQAPVSWNAEQLWHVFLLR